jgi:hypothetical protein
MSETDLQRAILAALEAKRYRAERINAGDIVFTQRLKSGATKRYRFRGARKSTPDVLVLKPYVWLETKTPIGEASPGQLEWHRWAAENGIRAKFVRSIGEALRYVDRCERDDRLRDKLAAKRSCPYERCPLEDS